jgi:DNA-binding GntR family transcriptional regulator
VGGTRVAEHRRIARSFTGGDPDKTDKLLSAHMEDAITRLVAGPRAATPTADGRPR